MIAAGQEFNETIIERIRERVSGGESITRTKLSREVCEWLDWRHEDGRGKEMNCRVALRRLDEKGVIELPAARAGAFFGGGERTAEGMADWAAAEFSRCELRDARLQQRPTVLARDFYARPQANLP